MLLLLSDVFELLVIVLKGYGISGVFFKMMIMIDV